MEMWRMNKNFLLLASAAVTATLSACAGGLDRFR